MRKDCSTCKQDTNADRIRAMTDEELAQWLNFEFGHCEWCDVHKED